jgi:hypothetical protein
LVELIASKKWIAHMSGNDRKNVARSGKYEKNDRVKMYKNAMRKLARRRSTKMTTAGSRQRPQIDRPRA